MTRFILWIRSIALLPVFVVILVAAAIISSFISIDLFPKSLILVLSAVALSILSTKE